MSGDGGPRLVREERTTRLEAGGLSLTFTDGRPWATLADAGGSQWGELALTWSADVLDALDTSAWVDRPEIEERPDRVELTLPLQGSAWARKHLRIVADDVGLRMRLETVGESRRLTDVTMLGGAWTGPRPGMARSRLDVGTVFTPEPERPNVLAHRATEAARIDVSAGRVPERGHWFFTPPPFCLAFSKSPPGADGGIPDGPWLWLGIGEVVGRSKFTALEYRPAEEGCSLVLTYEGQASAGGAWASPWLLFGVGASDPYAAIAAYRERLDGLGLLPVRRAGERPAWWSRPIFCGWGAQCADAVRDGGGAISALAHAPRYATQERYDGYLDALAERGLDPGTVTIDDKWQTAYGTNDVDTAKWPDLRGWITRQHERGRRVLLWWKAWDPEGLPEELCIRNRVGRSVSVDPTSPAYVERLRAIVGHLISPEGLDVDGFKIDFTAETPVGPGLTPRGSAWGVALLHRLLRHIREAAKAAKPDALIVAHAPNPGFVDVVDMVRLNDALRLAEPPIGVDVVRQMRHRARIVQAACPELLVDTDDWAMPDRATWRAYQRAKPEIGVPALYYVDRLDVSGEELTDEDAALVREVWDAAEAAAAEQRRRAATAS